MNTFGNALKIRLLDRLILLDLVPKLLMSIALFSTLFFALGPVVAAFRFVSQGVPAWVVAQFIGWDFAGFVSWTFPLGMMVAALLGFDRLSRDSEAVALFAGGISFPRMIVPVIGLGLVVSFVGYVFNDRIASYANQRVADIKDHRGDVVGETTKPFDPPPIRKDGKLQMTIHVERGYDVQAKMLRQVTITLYGADGRPSQVISADRAKSHGSGFKTWTLYGERSTDLATGATIAFEHVDSFELDRTPENMTFLQRDPETLNFHDLRQQIRELRADGSDSSEIRNAEVGLWFKTSLPFACLIFGLVGAPLGMRPPRSAKFSGSVWALPIMLGYYVIYMSMSSLATGGGVPPILAAWLPNLLGLIVGAGLIWKASR